MILLAIWSSYSVKNRIWTSILNRAVSSKQVGFSLPGSADAGGGGALPSPPPDFAKVEKWTEAEVEIDNLLAVAPQIFGPSATPFT